MSTDLSLLDLSRFDIKLGQYKVGPAAALSDPQILAATQDYRRLTGSQMMPVGKSDIRSKIPSSSYHVSRKIDGEFTVLVLRDGQVFSINPGGTVRIGLPWMAEAHQALEKAGIKEAMFAGELYVHNTERRPRVHDVTTTARQPKDQDDLERLRFAVFNVISMNEQGPSDVYADGFQTIESLFGSCERIHPVETQIAKDTGSIEKLFRQWVENEGAEGLVVRSDSAGLFKVKPRHTLDAVVIGFTESTGDRSGMMHDLLLAMMRDDGTLQILCRVGGGFSEEQRRSMLSDLKDMVVPSEYAEVNSDYVAYQMVRPEWVIEISCLDLISQTTRGGDINRMVLDFDSPDDGYRVVRRLPLVTVISPQFIRIREDKQAHPQDVRIAQVSEQVEVSLTDCEAKKFRLPTTELVKREVFVKEAKGKTMVRKFVLLKTNKEQDSEEYPAFVLHYTDFSPNRKSPLDRSVWVSNSQEQIESLYLQCKQDNIKKGWEPANTGSVIEQAPPDPVAEPKPASKKRATKKKVTKKKAACSDSPTKKTPAKKAAKKTAKKKPTAKKKAPKKPR